MSQDPNRPMEIEMEEVARKYMSMLFQLCYVHLRNHADAEDAVSETLIRYMEKRPAFNEEEHRKAWILRTAINICRDIHRYRKRHQYVNLEDFYDYVHNADRVPSLILLELNLKGVHGFKVIDTLEEMGGDMARVPIILLADADSDGQEVEGLTKNKVMDFIKKPFEEEILKVRVNHILELAALRKKYRILGYEE